MSEVKRWVLTDVARDIHVDDWEISGKELGLGGGDWTIRKRTLRGGLRDGVEIVEVNNGPLSYSILPTRGMGIWRGQYHGQFLGWNSPVVGPVHPNWVDLMDHGGIGWLAGFDEWIVRCGLNSNGAPGEDQVIDNQGNPQRHLLPLHGRIANQPAHYLEVRVGTAPPYPLEVIGSVDEAMLFFPRLRLDTVIRTTPGSSKFTIDDTVVNLRSQPAELQLLYHCNFGPPLLGEGASLIAPFKEVAPRDATAEREMDHFAHFPGPTAGVIEGVLFMELLADDAGRTLAALRSADGGLACGLRYDTGRLPCFTLWKNPGAESDGYVTGLEPATNYPNPKSFEREKGRVVKLAAGARYAAQLEIELADTAAGVAALVAEVDALQKKQPPRLHRSPSPRMSPA